MGLQGIFDPIVKGHDKKKYGGGGGGEGGTDALDTLVKAVMAQTPYELKSNVKGVIVGNFALGSAVTSIDLPNVMSVGTNAFANYRALTSVNLPSAKSIGYYALQN